jgi:hypothetical protein
MGNPTIGGALSQTLRGLHRAYYEIEAPAVMLATPYAQHNSATGKYTIPKTTTELQTTAADAPTATNTWGSDFEMGQPIEFDEVATSITPAKSKAYHIPDRVVEQLEAENPDLSVVELHRNLIVQQLYNCYVDRWIAGAANISGTSSLALTSRTVEVASYFLGLKETAAKTTGSRFDLNTLVLGPTAARFLAMQYETQSGNMIAGGSAFARLGSAELGNSFARLNAFLTAECGISLLVDSTVRAQAYRFNNATSSLGYLVRMGGPLDSTVLTFSQGSEGADVFRFYNDRATIPKAPGELVAADGAFDVHCAAPTAGYKITLTWS